MSTSDLLERAKVAALLLVRQDRGDEMADALERFFALQAEPEPEVPAGSRAERENWKARAELAEVGLRDCMEATGSLETRLADARDEARGWKLEAKDLRSKWEAAERDAAAWRGQARGLQRELEEQAPAPVLTDADSATAKTGPEAS